MRTLIKGLEVNYEVIGEGKPLLILHGWGSNSERWQKVGELLAERGVKVIIPDLPGFGNSQRPSMAWDLDDYCEFIQEFIKLLNLEKFYLLGHSFGGALAVKCSLKFPEKIDKLFLVSAACFRRKVIKKRFFCIIVKVLKIFSFLPGYQSIRKGFYKFIIRKSDYLNTEGIMKDIYLKIIKEDLSGILSQVQIPTIIIWGEKDDVTKIKEARLIN
ncbi:unnamed protein product, partial [marine sediment metagenome]